jgi:nucleoid DNA-binding protein
MEVKTDLLADVFSQLHKKNQEAPKAMEAEFTSVDDALEAKDPLEKLLGKP